MIQELANAHASWIRNLMQGYHLALSGALALDDASRARISIMVQSQSSLTLIGNAINDALNSARHQAMTDAGLSMTQLQGLPTLDEEAAERTRLIVSADARVALMQLQQLRLREGLLAARMSPDAARLAARGELPGQRHDLFVQLDKAQRRFTSEDLMLGHVRGIMVRTWGHSFASSLAAAGVDEFVARREGQSVDLSFTGNWQDWAAAELHPNCPWTLARKETP